MIGRRASTASSLIAALSLAVVAAGVWRWRSSVIGGPRVELASEPWDQLKASYPLPLGPQDAPTLSNAVVDSVLQANPFSPQRRAVSTAVGNPQQGGGGGRAPVAAGPPQFIYKGRIHLGKRQRAVIEETTAKKTYFLEVGQVVASFKVLDIKENQVVLSDPQTSKEVVVPLASKEASGGQ